MRKFFTIFLCFFNYIFTENISYILIHGTWATQTPWYQKGGDFFDTLSCVTDKTDTIISFSWSGMCWETERRIAAISLVTLLKKETEKNKKIVVIAHSHGGNVALHALTYIHHHHKEVFVAFLILLGTPIAHNYEPKNIPVRTLINIFSFNDLVQPVCGLFKRVFFGKNILNVSLVINNKEPMHNQLYHPLLAFFISEVCEIIHTMNHKNIKNVYMLNVDYHQGISINPLENWQEKLTKDQLFQEYLLSHLLWGPEESLYFLP